MFKVAVDVVQKAVTVLVIVVVVFEYVKFRTGLKLRKLKRASANGKYSSSYGTFARKYSGSCSGYSTSAG